MAILLGTWPADDLRRAFVEGAQWWEYHQTNATMWPSDRDEAEAEAEQRFPEGKRPEDDVLLIDIEAARQRAEAVRAARDIVSGSTRQE